jgi:glycine cleavage system regulatory protein
LIAQGLRIVVETGAEAAPAPGRLLRLEFVDHDRPGIVRDISTALAAHKISIDELETERESASFFGEAMFKAKARLKVPAEVDLDALRTSLEALANELMVDLDLEDA